MMKHKIIYLVALAMLTACSEDSLRVSDTVEGLPLEIRLQAEIAQVNVTRADDSGFADGDRIGVFAVSFTDNLNPGVLAPSGNLADNVRFTFDEASFSWKGDRQLYFADDKTPVDFYGCYPYDASINEVFEYPFSVQRNQSSANVSNGMGGYEASDFLWAKSAAVMPSSTKVNLLFKHILSAVQVTLLEGDSFEDGEWNALNKEVLVVNTARNALINLSNGEVTAAADKDGKNIIMNSNNGDFRAIVVPQTVPSGVCVISITVGSHSYELVKDQTMNYIPSKLHKFTIQVDKSTVNGDYEFSLIDESITAWESDLTSHNGMVKEYVVVEVPEYGQLQESMEGLKLDIEEIKNLKIVGKMNEQDFKFLRENLKYLEAINIKDVHLGACQAWDWDDSQVEFTLPCYAFDGMKTLSYITLPDKLSRIGNAAFLGTHISGSLILPEGLTYIGDGAFHNTTYGWDSPWMGGYDDGHRPFVYNNLTGSLSLPSTLKHIGSSAFAGCDFNCSLVFPDGLEYIGNEAFSGCEHIYGELHLPSDLEYLGDRAFEGMTKIVGKLAIPNKIKEVRGFGGLNLSAVALHSGIVAIDDGAFSGTSLTGPLYIPESITRIGRQALSGTKITGIKFPNSLEFIEDYVCYGNKFLQDTVVIPPLIETIGEKSFAECDKLDAVVLPKSLLRIKDGAFQNCYSLTYIHCQAVEPPALEESAFYGINKDNFTLEVPEESVDAYRSTPGWSEFKRISAYKNFVARPSKYNVLNKGGKKEIILNADGAWEMTECPSWCHIDKTSGSMKTVITLTVDAMAHGQASRKGIITFRLDDADGHLTHINIGQYDYEYDEDQSIQLQKASKGKGVDVVFLGDGYDAIDISNGLYLQDMKQELEYFFAVEPYSTYKDYFNVYTTFALSEDSGVESLNRWRTTKFHTSIGDGTTRLSSDWQAAMNYTVSTISSLAEQTNPEVGVILVANSEMYEGVTYCMTDINSFCSVVTKSALPYPNDARGLIQHEAGGHGLGWLADEYIYHQAFINKCTCICCSHASELIANHSNGFGLNLSLSGKYREVPWTHLIYRPDYGDIVDIYEGGYFHSRGVYRSEYNSCMNNNVPYFSTWSRQLIVQRIMKLAGETFDLNAFYANDSRATGRDFSRSTRGDLNDASAFAPKGQAPHIIKNFKFYKKGGRK